VIFKAIERLKKTVTIATKDFKWRIEDPRTQIDPELIAWSTTSRRQELPGIIGG
jgi:hypothetical protein